LKRASVGERALDFWALDQDVAHAALIDLVEQLRKGNVLGGRVLAGVLEQREQCQEQQQDNDDRQGEIPKIGIHRRRPQGRAFDYFSQIANTHPNEPPGTAQARIVANAFVAPATII